MAPDPILRLTPDGQLQQLRITLRDGIRLFLFWMVGDQLDVDTVFPHPFLDHLVIQHRDVILAGKVLRPIDHSRGLVQELRDIAFVPVVGRLVTEHHIGRRDVVLFIMRKDLTSGVGEAHLGAMTGAGTVDPMLKHLVAVGLSHPDAVLGKHLVERHDHPLPVVIMTRHQDDALSLFEKPFRQGLVVAMVAIMQGTPRDQQHLDHLQGNLREMPIVTVAESSPLTDRQLRKSMPQVVVHHLSPISKDMIRQEIDHRQQQIQHAERQGGEGIAEEEDEEEGHFFWNGELIIESLECRV